MIKLHLHKAKHLDNPKDIVLLFEITQADESSFTRVEAQVIYQIGGSTYYTRSLKKCVTNQRVAS